MPRMQRIRPCRRHLLAGLLVAALAGLAAGKETEQEKARRKAWEEAQATFAREFRSEDPSARRAAVLKLAEFADMGSGRLIVEDVLGKERHAGVLDAAIAVLGKSKRPEDIEFICGKVVGKGDWQMRAPLADALGSLDAPAAAGAIRTLLRTERDPRVLSMALFGAGQKKLTDAIDLVIPCLEHSDWQVRVAAIETLATFKDERGSFLSSTAC